ncbi:MAG: O-antigen ligase family protein [Candidatus Merdivicinus sp.]|jgi:O-antigen ligase
MEHTKASFRHYFDILFSHQAYRIVLLILVTLRSSALLAPYVGPTVKFTLIWAVVILLKDLFTERLLLVNRWRGWLYVFLILYGVTTLTQYPVSFARNIAMLCYMAVNLLLFYSYDLSRSREDVKREIQNLCHTFMAVSFATAIVSLAAFVLNIHYAFSYTSSGVEEYSWVGFYSGRLWGIISNPNAGGDLAVLNLIMMFLCLVIAGKGVTRLQKRFYIVNLVVQSAIFFLSNSRTAWLCILFFIMLIPFLFMLTNFHEKIQTMSLKKLLQKTIAAALVAMFTFAGLDTFAKAVLPHLVIPTDYFSLQLAQLPNSSLSEEEEPVFEEAPTDVVRDDYGYFLGGRSYLWRAGVGIIANHPLFGVSSENVADYAEQYAAWPQSYEEAKQEYEIKQQELAETKLAAAREQLEEARENGCRDVSDLEKTVRTLENTEIPEYEPYLPGIDGGLHNMLIQIAASSGLPALAIIIVVAVSFLVYFIRYIIYAFSRKKVNLLILSMGALILTLLVRSMSETGLIYGIYYVSIIFWSFVGYTIYFIEKETAGDSAFRRGSEPVLARLTNKIFSKKKGR